MSTRGTEHTFARGACDSAFTVACDSNQFSQSVAYEVAEFGVDVLGVFPYYISGTGLYSAPNPTLNAPSAHRIAEDTLKVLGTTKMAYPYVVHELMGWGFLNLLPDTGAKMLEITKLAKKRNDAPKKKD